MKFFEIINKPLDLNSKNFEIFQFLNTDLIDDDFFVRKEILNEIEKANIINNDDEEHFDIKEESINYFKEQNILDILDLEECVSKDDFDIFEEDFIEDSLHKDWYDNKLFINKLKLELKKIKSNYIKKKKQEKEKKNEEVDPNKEHFFSFLKYSYKKKLVKNRKHTMSIRPGVSDSPKKNSLIRNKNITILNQILNIFIKDGNKKTVFKHHNIMYNEFYNFFKENELNVTNYHNFNYFKELLKNEPKNTHNFNLLLLEHMPIFDSLFNIKTKKNKKIKNRLDIKKYSHEIVYVKKDKRVRNTLKVLKIYNENFKSYFFWERLFLMYLSIIVNWQNSFLIKRRSYIYVKSSKFFKVNNGKKNYS